MILFSCSVLAAEPAERPWRLRLNDDGIEVYTRKVPGSSYLEFNARMQIKEPILKLMAIIEDQKLATSWFYRCVYSEVLKEEDVNHVVVYTVTHLPWPASERDCVFRITKSVDQVTGVVEYKAEGLPEYHPRKPGKIRVASLSAVWRLISLPDGGTEIVFQQHSEPGGVLPTILANSLVVDIPFDSFRNLRRLAASINKIDQH